MKNSQKKSNIREPAEEMERQLSPVLELPPRDPGPGLGPEERVEILQDGSGEENPNQALQPIQDRTPEQMLGASTSAVHSGLDLPAERSVAEPRRRGARAHRERVPHFGAAFIRKWNWCMANARIRKEYLKESNIREPAEEMERQLSPVLELPPRDPGPGLGPEERVEILQQSGNIDANIQDITLKEAAIPELELPVNDGSGEENPNQALQPIQDRTPEQMLGASTSAVHSGLDLPAERSVAEPRRRGARAHRERVPHFGAAFIRKWNWCMANARIRKEYLKESNIREPAEEMERQLSPVLELPPRDPGPGLGPEERVEILQQSGNIDANIQDITLKEAAIPELELPVNDGSGEENPNQALQPIQDRTPEQMLGASTSAVHSGLDLPAERSVAEPRRRGARAHRERVPHFGAAFIRKWNWCMANARIRKEYLKESNIREPAEEMERQLSPVLELPPRDPGPGPGPEERVEILQQSGNIDANIQDITLKEAAIPELQLAVNDGSGEENPNQALQPIQDRTPEQMLGASTSAVHSGLDLPAERSVAEPRRRGARAHRERVPHFGAAFIRKWNWCMANARIRKEYLKETTELEQVAPIPEPTTEAPVQQEKPSAEVLPVEEEIEELGELEPQEKRRRKNKLIIDKRTIIPSDYFRSRLDNIAVELRCENSSEDIVDLEVPWDILSTRPAAAGVRGVSRLPGTITRLFLKKAGLAANHPLEQREMKLPLASRSPRTQPPLEVVPEEQPALEPEAVEPQDIEPQATEPQPMEPQFEPQLPMEEVRLDKTDLRPSVGQDKADVPTQKLEVSLKRPATQDDKSPKRQRCGFTSFRQDQLFRQEDSERFIREQWGTEGTMVKILQLTKARAGAVTVHSLLARGPLLPGKHCRIAARCFTSVLKLKHHGFIKVLKDPETLEGIHIQLAPKYDKII